MDVAPGGDGNSITFNDFAKCMYETAEEDIPDEDIRRAFSAFDKDGSGYICPHDLQKMMRSVGECVSQSEAEDMIRDVDTNCDGKISFEEFRRVINSVA
eukprot:SAG11_NODE_720_length_7550_cov_12.284257_4_plen_99_part_00